MAAPAISVAAVLLSLTTGAQAEPFPARSGETGILDVPDAQAAGPGRGQLAVEYRIDRAAGTTEAGPMPVYAVSGITRRLDLGFAVREWGQPGDPRPSRVLFGGAAKLQLAAPQGRTPGAALSLVLDRFNDGAVLGARAVASGTFGPLEAAAFLGGEARPRRLDGLGATAGLAVVLPLAARTALAAEALAGPRGESYGLALRWALSPTTGLSIGGNYLAPADGVRLAVTLAFSPARAPAAGRAPEEAPPAPTPAKPEAAVGPRFAGERPRFRLRMALASPDRLGRPRHLQYGPPPPPPAGSAAGSGAPASPVALLETQVRAAQIIREARERRARVSSGQLDAREQTAVALARKLDGQEQELAARERELDARARLLARPRVPATPEQQRLEALEAELDAQERNLAAQAGGLAPAVDAARGRERDAASREELERKKAQGPPAPAGGARRAGELEARRTLLAAQNRQLAATELRLAAKGARLDATERQLGIRSQRIEAWQRRLAARGDRLDLLGRLPAPAAPAAGGGRRGKVALVVSSPTIVMRIPRPGAPAAPGGAAAERGAAVRGVAGLLAGEKGERQVRAAVQAVQGSIERCVGDRVAETGLERGDLVLTLSVSPEGRIARVVSGEGKLAGPALDACLSAASREWRFPTAEGEYLVDLPISAVAGKAR